MKAKICVLEFILGRWTIKSSKSLDVNKADNNTGLQSIVKLGKNEYCNI